MIEQEMLYQMLVLESEGALDKFLSNRDYKEYFIDLGAAFVWSSSEEGHLFWGNINITLEDKKLRKI